MSSPQLFFLPSNNSLRCWVIYLQARYPCQTIVKTVVFGEITEGLDVLWQIEVGGRPGPQGIKDSGKVPIYSASTPKSFCQSRSQWMYCSVSVIHLLICSLSFYRFFKGYFITQNAFSMPGAVPICQETRGQQTRWV